MKTIKSKWFVLWKKPHVKGKFHEHKTNRVMVYLQPGRQRFEYQDGRTPAVFEWTAGEVQWSPSDGMHSPEVIGDEPFNIIEVQLKKADGGETTPSALDPLTIDPTHYKLEFQNDQVRVLRVRIGAHEKTPMHEHALNRVTVFLTDQSFRSKTPDGKVESVHHKAGEVTWGTPLKHEEENLSDHSFEAVLVEVRN